MIEKPNEEHSSAARTCRMIQQALEVFKDHQVILADPVRGRWRKPMDPEVAGILTEKLKGFPFKYSFEPLKKGR